MLWENFWINHLKNNLDEQIKNPIMETSLGKVTKEATGYKVVFQRVFNHDIESVWDALTNPDKMKFWFTDIDMDFKPGGKLTIKFRNEAKDVSYGEIVSIEAPHKFVFTWEHEVAVWELFEEGNNKCKLILTYSKLDENVTLGAVAGLHALLDRLDGMLDGKRILYPFGTEGDDPEHIQMKESYSIVLFKDYPELKRLEPLIFERTYNAPVERVWKAITDKDQMKQWYFDLSEFKPEIGFEFQFYGQGHKGEHYLHLCKVTEAEPLKKLTYSWSYEGYKGMSYVSFELNADGNKTKLKLTHKGLHTFPENNPDFAKESFTQGWTELIGTLLKNFVEKQD